MKPTVFIGSSIESLKVAEALQQNLDHFAYVNIWYQNVFELSKSYLSSLIEALDKYDFAIFIFSPDDKVISRDTEFATVRDNVLYEMGLFTGRLGIEKVYFLKPRGIDVKIPSDLLGIRAGDYDEKNPDLNSALSSFSTEVKKLIDKHNAYHFPESGAWGLNLLNDEINTAVVQKNYSITCKAPVGKKPKILVQPLTDIQFGFRVGREIDATVDLEDGVRVVRFLKNIGDKEITFNSAGKIQLTLYEDNSSKPILIKEISII